MNIDTLNNPLYDIIGFKEEKVEMLIPKTNYLFKTYDSKKIDSIKNLVVSKCILMGKNKSMDCDIQSIINSEFVYKIKSLATKNREKNYINCDLNFANLYSSDIFYQFEKLTKHLGINNSHKGFILTNRNTYDAIKDKISEKILSLELNLEIYVICSRVSPKLHDKNFICNNVDILYDGVAIMGIKKDGLVAGIKIDNNDEIDLDTDGCYSNFITETTYLPSENYYIIQIGTQSSWTNYCSKWNTPWSGTTSREYYTNYEKWKPIINAYNVTDEKVKIFMSEYAEYYQKVVCINGVNSESSLPISLKILSKLNLKDKNIIIKDNQPAITFDYNEPFTTTIDIGIESEKYLIDQVSNYLNKELETKNNLYITVIIESISVISELDKSIIRLTSRCSVE